MPTLKSAAISAAITLATIYLWNRFMDSNISSLGVDTSPKK